MRLLKLCCSSRYDYGGKPLPMVPIPLNAVPRCSNCAAELTFEMQLLPSLLQNLSVSGKTRMIDVGTVMIFTCSRNCWNGKVVHEFIMVQHDPDEHLLSKFKPNTSTKVNAEG